MGFTLPPEQSWIATYSQIGSVKGKVVAVYRTFLFVLASIVFVNGIDNYFDGDVGYFFIYLTHWGATWEFIYFGLLCVTTWLAVVAPVETQGEKQAAQSTPLFVSITWLLGCALPSLTLLIAILFWALVYEGNGVKIGSVILHGGNYLPVLMDLVSTRQPFYLRHVYVPIIGALIYSVFTYVYHLADGTNEKGKPYIYSAIDWEQTPGSAAVTLALASTVGVPMAHAFHSLLLLLLRSVCGTAQTDRSTLKVDPPKGETRNDAAETA